MPVLDSMSRRAALGSLVTTAAVVIAGQKILVPEARIVPAAETCPTPPPTPPPATGRLWLSGAGDDTTSNIANGGFAAWRGEPVTYARIWADASIQNMKEIWMMDNYRSAGWTGTLDIACGGPRDGQTWASAATGGMDAIWRTTCRTVLAKWGKLRCVHLSMAHELNGNWYPWSINSGNVNSFRTAWVRWYNIVQQELVAKGKRAKVVLSMNSDTVGGVSVQRMLPDRRYFDVLGCDFYSMWPDLNNLTQWNANRSAMKSDGSPRGIQSWYNYARLIGKPISFPEWGVNPQQRTDNAFFIERMRNGFSSNASADPHNAGAGKVAGEAYFNTWSTCRLWPSSSVPSAAAKYRAVSFGR